MPTLLTALGDGATILLTLMEVWKYGHARTAGGVGDGLTLSAPTWRAHGIGRYEWTSGRSEDTPGCVADSAVYLPLDLAKMVYDDLR